MVSGACKARGGAILDRAGQGATVIEVGALVGHLAAWCLSQRPDLRWLMVDSWRAAGDQPEHYRATGDDHALHDAARATKHRKLAYDAACDAGASVLHMDSTDAARLVAPYSADLVFIDADHSYQGCAADISAWTGAVRPGGWLGGHDYRNPDPRFGGVDRAVDERFTAEPGANFTWWVRL